MTARSIGETMPFAGGRKRRGDPDNPTDPVRSHSYDVQDRRASPYRMIGDGSVQQGKAFKRALCLTIDDLERKHAKGEHRGAYRITPARAIVVKTLIDKLDHKTGQLDPSWQTLAEDSARGRSTVDRALEAAEHHGFIAHVRRSIAIEGAEGQRRPQRKQTSSAVYFDCQARMAPALFARFWHHFLAELGKFGRHFRNRARRLLTTFNPTAVPSPREPKVSRLVAKARDVVSVRQPARVPVQGRQGRPVDMAPPAPTARPASATGLDAVLARMALRFGIDPEEVMNEGPK